MRSIGTIIVVTAGRGLRARNCSMRHAEAAGSLFDRSEIEQPRSGRGQYAGRSMAGHWDSR